MKALIVLMVFAWLSPLQAEIYKWVDGAGNVHYGDEPQSSGANRMQNLPGLSTYQPRSLPEPEPSSPVKQVTAPADISADSRTSSAANRYREITIVSPEQGAEIRSKAGVLPVFLALAPVLKKDDYLQIWLDGKLQPAKYQSSVIRLQDLAEGEHRLVVAVHGKEGGELLRSSERTFSLKKK